MNRDLYAEAQALADALVGEGLSSDAQELRDAILAGATSTEILGGMRAVLRRFDRANKTSNLVTKRQIRSLLEGLNVVLHDMPELEQVHFRLERDADGFPPMDVEDIWSRSVDAEHFRLYYVPLFARGIANGDVVRVRQRGGRLWFVRVTEEGGHGTIRVNMVDKSRAHGVKEIVRGFGCHVRQSDIRGHFAIDVLPDAKKTELLAYLREQRAAKTLDYEEGCKNW